MLTRHLTARCKNLSALGLFQNSCYHKIDFKINEDRPVSHAVQKFALFNVGCLAVTNQHNHVVGVLSERDYIHKISALDRDSTHIKIKDICTYEPTILANHNDSIEHCAVKMLSNDIRHLLVVDDSSRECMGMISIKDVVKELIRDKNNVITRLSDFKSGRGGYFGSE
jgi:predicted transcriptional regulator